METLTQKQEQQICDFAFELALIDGPEDMFPPDDFGGVREPRRPVQPSGCSPEAICLAAVYDITRARERRTALERRGRALMRDIELVLA